jgi:hypothetical protein
MDHPIAPSHPLAVRCYLSGLPTVQPVPHPDDRRRFYQSAMAILRALDAKAPVPRRFGAEADARWALFKGDLALGDRLDLLVRDGAATQPTAFAPRVVFALDGLASDEPFGPDWPEPGREPSAILP